MGTAAEKSEQPVRPPAGVDRGEHPAAVHAGQLEIARTDQARTADVDEPVPEHVGAQQHLAVAPFEPAQVDFGAGQLQHLAVEGADLFDRHEDVAAADGGDQAGDQRIVGTPQPHDDVRQPAERLAAAVRERAAQQPGQVKAARGCGSRNTRSIWCRRGRRCRGHALRLHLGWANPPCPFGSPCTGYAPTREPDRGARRQGGDPQFWVSPRRAAARRAGRAPAAHAQT